MNIKYLTPMVAALTAIGVIGCSQAGAEPADPPSPSTQAVAAAPIGAQPRLAADPAKIADDLVTDQLALRDPSTPEAVAAAVARRQQAAYRAIGRHPEWDGIVRPRIPQTMLAFYDRNIDARRQLNAMATVRNTLPAWRIESPAPAGELLAYYREAEAATGVGWNYLAAINLVETRLGSIVGDSTAGAQGPMQFLPATFASYGRGGDVHSPHDAIMAAGRFLAASGFASSPERAIFVYNHADEYVRAVSDYAAVLAADPASFGDFYRWDVYYFTTAGDVLLPIGYAASTRIPVESYLASHPQ